ncbi:serine hydrolase [Verrucomicrobia bacterium LW23]|nr:serine hydrolase [Verrucomicrobia bacterium LW23]
MAALAWAALAVGLMGGASILAPMQVAAAEAPAPALPQGAAVAEGAAEVLDDTLRPFLAEFGLPAIGAAVVVKGNVVAIGAVGTRALGREIPVTVGDRWHIGSDTKAMTATLLAMEVEAGRLKWTSTPGDVFPELKASMDPGFAAMPLERLLSHTSGLEGDNDGDWDLFDQARKIKGNLDEARYFVVKTAATRKLHHPQGEFAYSNLGYLIAGAMLERAAGTSWEELIVAKLFEPLGLTSAGLGPQGTLGKIDAPLGHMDREGKPFPLLPGPYADNPPVIGPAGTAHMSLADFARWASWNAAEGARKPHLLKPESFKRLHTPMIMMDNPNARPGTPRTGGYGLGWMQNAAPWTGGRPVLFHGGSNTFNLAHIFVDTEKDAGIVITTNISNPKATEALMKLAQVLYKKYVTH